MTNDEQGNEQGIMTEQTEQQREWQSDFSTLDSTLATLRAWGHYPLPVGTVDPTVVGTADDSPGENVMVALAWFLRQPIPAEADMIVKDDAEAMLGREYRHQVAEAAYEKIELVRKQLASVLAAGPFPLAGDVSTAMEQQQPVDPGAMLPGEVPEGQESALAQAAVAVDRMTETELFGAVLLAESLANMAQLLMAQLVKGAVRRHPATIVHLATLARFMRENNHGQPDTLLVQLSKQATTNYYRAALSAANGPLAMIQELLAGGSDTRMQ